LKSSAPLWKSAVLWALLASLTASLYGILNDQVTVTLSPEYFTVFKHRQFQPLLSLLGLTDAPLRIRALVIGAASSWWFGAIAGLLLSVAGCNGSMPPLSLRTLLKCVGFLLLTTLGASLLGGLLGMFVGCIAAPGNHVTPLAVLMVGWGIRDYQSAILVGCWHTGGYLGGILGLLLVLRRIRHLRRRADLQESIP
jgi:hypothetical protein